MRVTGSFSGSWRRAAAGATTSTASTHTARQARMEAERLKDYSQSLISNSGSSFRCRSLIFSSRYLAPTPFSKCSEAPRL